jgi:hypothetical protein
MVCSPAEWDLTVVHNPRLRRPPWGGLAAFALTCVAEQTPITPAQPHPLQVGMPPLTKVPRWRQSASGDT